MQQMKLWTGALVMAALVGCGNKSPDAAQPAAAAPGTGAPAAAAPGDSEGEPVAAGPIKQEGGWAPKPAAPGWDKEYLPEDDNWKQFKQELMFNNGADIETLDPAVVTGVPEHRIFMALYEGLVIHNPETTAPCPGVAETWKVSDDGRTYTFTLRKDAKWSNGDAVTAGDFYYSWYRVLAPYPASQYAYMLHDIQGAKAFNEGRVAETELPLFEDQACTKPNGQKLAVGDVVNEVKKQDKFPQEFPDNATEEDLAKEAWKVTCGDKSGWVLRKSLRGEGKIDGAGFATVGLKVVDDHTLQVTLAAPKAYFLDILAHQTQMPVQRKNVEPWDLKRKADQAFRTENFVGNGTHVLKELTPRKHIVMTKSPTYWNRGIVMLEKITALPIDAMETAYAKFQADEVDWLMAVPVSKIDEVKQHPDYYVAPYLGTYFYRINCNERAHPDDPNKPHPLTDKRVRMALNLAIDKKTICEKVTKAGQIPAEGFVPPGIPGYPQFEGLPFDRARARELMAEAGYPGGKGFPKVEVLYNTSESHKKVAEALAGMWEETLGIVIGLSNTEWKVYLDQVDQENYDIARAGWIGDYGDPNTFMDMWITAGGNNNTGWSNAEYDALYKKTMSGVSAAERMQAFQKMEEIICKDEFPVIPIYYYVNQGLLKEKVRGVYENIRDLHPWQYIWIEEE
ncbi:MAG: peptide ABC transporter substrate-binding protein [Planctomycetota bacterium]|jgi:oligopeptide transport system substrate-binding protein